MEIAMQNRLGATLVKTALFGRSGSPKRFFRGRIAVLGGLATLLVANVAMAQSKELFSPLAAANASTVAPSSQETVNKLRNRPTTKSLALVTVDINALCGIRTLGFRLPT